MSSRPRPGGAGWGAGKRDPDPKHEPYPEKIHVHGNRYDGGGDRPGGALETFLALLVAPSRRIPDIVWDGQIDPESAEEAAASVLRIEEATGVEFINLNFGRPGGTPSRDASAHRGSFPRLPGVAGAGTSE